MNVTPNKSTGPNAEILRSRRQHSSNDHHRHNQNGSSETILPLSSSISVSSPDHQLHHPPTNNGHSASFARNKTTSPLKASPNASFLLGGNYYPGKDKKRPSRTFRRRTQSSSSSWSTLSWHFSPRRWLRLLRLSPFEAVARLVAAVLVVGVVVFLFVRILALLLVFGGGGEAHQGKRHSILSPLTTDLPLPSLKQAKAAAERLHRQRHFDATSSSSSPDVGWAAASERFEILQMMVPDFVHRNEAVHPHHDETKEEKKMVAKHRQQQQQKSASTAVKEGGNVVSSQRKIPSHHQHGEHAPTEGQDALPQQQMIPPHHQHGEHAPTEGRNYDTESIQQKQQQQHAEGWIQLSDHRHQVGATSHNNGISSSTGVSSNETKKWSSPRPVQRRSQPASMSSGEGGMPHHAAVIHSQTVPSSSTNSSQMMERHIMRTLTNMHSFASGSRCAYTSRSLSPDDLRVTLVVQSTLNRIWILEETCRRWTDPIVAVVALTTNEMHRETTAMLVGWEVKCPQLTLLTHKLEPPQLSTSSASSSSSHGTDKNEAAAGYPVNFLRNLGLDAVETSHILVMDIDFVPSRNLANQTRQVLQRQHQRKKYDEGHDRTALVIPAFERVLSTPCLTEKDCKQFLRHNRSFIPSDFEEIRQCVLKKDCNVFQMGNNWEGHYSTHSERWLAQESYDGEASAKNDNTEGNHDVMPIKCFDSLRYEPYVVIRWCPASTKESNNRTLPVAPYYDERFHGYGKNKIEYIQHLRIMGYEFAVLPRGFIVHNPHVESPAKQQWNNVQDSNLHVEMDRLYPQFLQELMDKYHNNVPQEHRPSVVGLCKRG